MNANCYATTGSAIRGSDSFYSTKYKGSRVYYGKIS